MHIGVIARKRMQITHSHLNRWIVFAIPIKYSLANMTESTCDICQKVNIIRSNKPHRLHFGRIMHEQKEECDEEWGTKLLQWCQFMIDVYFIRGRENNNNNITWEIGWCLCRKLWQLWALTHCIQFFLASLFNSKSSISLQHCILWRS